MNPSYIRMLIRYKEEYVTLSLWEASSTAMVHILDQKRNISELAFRIPYHCHYVFNQYLPMRGDASAVCPSVPYAGLMQLLRVDQVMVCTEQARQSEFPLPCIRHKDTQRLLLADSPESRMRHMHSVSRGTSHMRHVFILLLLIFGFFILFYFVCLFIFGQSQFFCKPQL